MPGGRQHVVVEDLAVGGDHQQVRLPRAELGNALGGVDALGLVDGDAALLGNGLHASADLARRAARRAHRPVRLRHQTHDGTSGVKQCPERRLREGAGAHHDNSHSE